MIRILLILILTSSVSLSFGQKQVDLKLTPSGTLSSAQCFDVMLRSPHGEEIKLAGQNYRLFYSADKLDFLADKIHNPLDGRTYSKIDLLHTEDHSIGFVSISIDGKQLSDKTVVLDRAGTWQKTISVCFDSQADRPIDLTWANAKKTALYATAEVAFSEWVNADEQQVLILNEVIDFSSVQIVEIPTSLDVRIFPNPVVDEIQIQLNGAYKTQSLVIQDVIGREVIREKLVSQDNMILTFESHSWPEGMYTVHVLDGDGQSLSTRQIIKVSP